MQIKTTVRCHLTPVRMTIIKIYKWPSQGAPQTWFPSTTYTLKACLYLGPIPRLPQSFHCWPAQLPTPGSREQAVQLSQHRESTSEEAKLLHSEQDFSLHPALPVCAETVKDPALSLRDQTLSLWSGSTDSKILDYQRTNPFQFSVQSLSHVQLLATPWTAACQASLSITNSQSPPKLTLEVKVKVKLLSRVWLFATPWTVARQALPSMGFSRQEYWSGLPFPSPGDLPKTGIEPRSPTLQADTLTSELPWKPN